MSAVDLAHILVARPWRVGRRNGRVIYAIVGEAPSDDDVMIGSFDSVGLAAEAVTAHNARLSGKDEE